MSSSSLYLWVPLHIIYHNTLTENMIYKAVDVLGFLTECKIHTHICSVHSQSKNRDIKEEQILSPSTSNNPFHMQTIVLLEEICFCSTENRISSWPRSPTLQWAYYVLAHCKHYDWLICVLSTETANNQASEPSLRTVGYTFSFIKMNKSLDFSICLCSFLCAVNRIRHAQKYSCSSGDI